MRRQTRKKLKTRKTSQRIIKAVLYTSMVLVTLLLSGAMLGIGVAAGIVNAIVKDEKVRTKDDLQKDLDSLFQTSYAYFQSTDKNGQPILIGSLRAEKNDRTLIKNVKDVSPNLVNAFIAIEDRDFYNHKGIVPRSIIRAGFQQATESEVQTGGSTITQQLVKNIVLKDRGKNLDRKTKEIVLSLRMEQLYSKEDILTYYMNVVHFGPGAHGQQMYGVKAAARGLFFKDPKDLTIAQTAYIAGMVQRPNAMSPFYDEDPKSTKDDEEGLRRGINRMKLVLQKMKEQKYITEQQYQEAITFDIKGSLAKKENFSNGYSKYPYIMFTIEDEAALTLMKIDGLAPEELKKQGKFGKTLKEYKELASSSGYKFYTTIDEDLYNQVNESAMKGISKHTRSYKGKKYTEEIGACIIENKTGAVLAFVPSSGSFTENEKDHCFDVTNQPGSAIKPLLDYGPALELGLISPKSKIVDEPIKKAGKGEDYKNANESYRGPVTVEDALKFSYNTPAIKTFNKVGQERAFSFIKQMGLIPHPNDGESSSIGGNTEGFTVKNMTAAYATFANGGIYHKPYVITKIEDADGKVIYEHKKESTKVFSPQTSYKITKMLKNVIHGGTASALAGKVRGYDVVGKTGTTNDYRDVWFVGYTPEISIGVWAGYDYNMVLSGSGKNMAKDAWGNIFRAVANYSPNLLKGNFSNPGGLGGEIPGFDSGRVAEWQKEKAATDQKKQEEERKKHNPSLPPSPPPNGGSTPPPPVTTPGGGNDKDPGGPGKDPGGTDTGSGKQP